MNTALKTFIIVVIILLALSILPMIFGWGMMGGGMMGPGYGGGRMGFGIGWVLMWIIGLVIFAAFVAGVVWLVSYVARSGTGPAARQEETPLDILKKRYARGEINKQEFEEKKKDLG